MSFAHRKKNEKSKASTPQAPFEAREKIYGLSLFFTVVSRNQSHYYENAYQNAGASMSLTFYAHSMPPQEILAMLGEMETKKDIVVTICRSELVPVLKKIATERFEISRAAKGIAFACPIDAVQGIAAYRFLADQNKEIRQEESKHGRKTDQK